MRGLTDRLTDWALVLSIIFGPTTIAYLILGPQGLS